MCLNSFKQRRTQTRRWCGKTQRCNRSWQLYILKGCIKWILQIKEDLHGYPMINRTCSSNFASQLRLTPNEQEADFCFKRIQPPLRTLGIVWPLWSLSTGALNSKPWTWCNPVVSTKSCDQTLGPPEMIMNMGSNWRGINLGAGNSTPCQCCPTSPVLEGHIFDGYCQKLHARAFY
jgi:hypothetical protein